MMREGTWWIASEKDPRWNKSGKGYVGCFSRPQEAVEAVEELKALYGPPPDDLEWGYMKD